MSTRRKNGFDDSDALDWSGKNATSVLQVCVLFYFFFFLNNSITLLIPSIIVICHFVVFYEYAAGFTVTHLQRTYETVHLFYQWKAHSGACGAFE